jgi:hypothetical protein
MPFGVSFGVLTADAIITSGSGTIPHTLSNAIAVESPRWTDASASSLLWIGRAATGV